MLHKGRGIFDKLSYYQMLKKDWSVEFSVPEVAIDYKTKRSQKEASVFCYAYVNECTYHTNPGHYVHKRHLMCS